MLLSWLRQICAVTHRCKKKIFKKKNQSTDSTDGSIVSECRLGNYPERGQDFHLTLNFLQFKHSSDSDQTPRSAASDVGLHCLPMPQMFQSRFYRLPSINSTLTSQHWNCAAIDNRTLFRLTCGLITLVSDSHVDNYLKEILAFVYYVSIVNNRPFSLSPPAPHLPPLPLSTLYFIGEHEGACITYIS